MKIFKLLSIAFLLTTLIACSGDDDGNTTTPEDDTIVGTWNLIAINSDTALDLNEDGTASTELETEKPCVLDTQVSFSADGTLMNNPSFAILAFGNISITCVDSSFDGTWSLDENELTLTQEQVTSTGTIILDGDTLTFLDVTQGLGGATLDGVYQRQ